MFRIIFLALSLIINFNSIAQTRFMVGISVDPNISWSTIQTNNYVRTLQNPNSTNTNQNGNSIIITNTTIVYRAASEYYSPGVSIGAGLNFGAYVGKKFFLLTGIERTKRMFNGQSVYDNQNLLCNSWEVPLLMNYMLTEKYNKVSFFLSGGFTGGIITSEVTKAYDQVQSLPLSSLDSHYYLNAVAGVDCKINLNQRFSLLVIPQFSYKITNTNSQYIYGQTISTATLRTMLMYNF